MCLYTYDKEPLIAKEDIICYKVVEYDPESGKYGTPFMNINITEYVKNKTIWKDSSVPPIHRTVVDKDLFGKVLYEIGIGYIHAFTFPFECEMYETYKCIIPKGTEYYIGFSKDICARAIQFVEEYKPEEEC